MPRVLALAVVGTAAGAFSGLAAFQGAYGYVDLAKGVPERGLEVSFAMLQLVAAYQLARRTLTTPEETT